MQQRILELIWKGAVRPMDPCETSRLLRVLKTMVPVPFVCLAANAGIDRIKVLPDELEVMPALPLGDVIVEELAVDVPYGALLLAYDDGITGSPMDNDAMSYDVGIAVGEVLLTVLRGGLFPLERENEALFVMACAFDRMARTTGMQHLGLVPTEFSKGLAERLGTYWSGSRLSRTEQTGLFLGTSWLAGQELRRYLLMLDGGFSAPQYERIPGGLLAFAGTWSFGDWQEKAQAAVTGVLGERDTRLIRS